MSTALAILALVIAFGLGFLVGRWRRVSAPPTPTTPPLPAQADITALQAERDQLAAERDRLGAERDRLGAELATVRTKAARYRQLVIDIENNAPPPLFGPGAPDDLKLIVGVGPVLERMLQQLGVTTFRQIAHWSDGDIDEFDAKLHEFPGRIRRDGWVTQARELHQSKYGETLPPRGR